MKADGEKDGDALPGAVSSASDGDSFVTVTSQDTALPEIYLGLEPRARRAKLLDRRITVRNHSPCKTPLHI